MSEKLVNAMGGNESAAACYEHFHVGCFLIRIPIRVVQKDRCAVILSCRERDDFNCRLY